MRYNSEISAEAFNNGNGGNIKINAADNIFAILLDSAAEKETSPEAVAPTPATLPNLPPFTPQVLANASCRRGFETLPAPPILIATESIGVDQQLECWRSESTNA